MATEEDSRITSPGPAEDAQWRPYCIQMADTKSLLADPMVCGPREHQGGTDERTKSLYPQTKDGKPVWGHAR